MAHGRRHGGGRHDVDMRTYIVELIPVCCNVNMACLS